MEEWKTKGELLQELDYLRSRVAQLEKENNGDLEGFGQGLIRIFNNFSEGVFFANLQNKRLVTGNKAICQMLGYNADETTNLAMTSICPHEETTHLMEQFEKQVSGELVFRKDVLFRRKDGSLFHADVISVPLTFRDKRYLMCCLRETSYSKIKSILQHSLPHSPCVSQPLTKAEISVLKLVVTGMSNKEIARLFHRSVRTIENHRAHVMKKLGVDSSVELVKQAVAMGLVELSGE